MDFTVHPEHDMSTNDPPRSGHPLAGRVIVITGAASGIGRCLALHLASHGVRLALTDLDVEGGRTVCEEVRATAGSQSVVFAAVDISNHDLVGRLMRTFGKTYGRLDGLVNCAGINRPAMKPSHEMVEEFAQTMMDINLKGTISLTSHFIREIYNNPNAPAPLPGGYSIV